MDTSTVNGLASRSSTMDKTSEIPERPKRRGFSIAEKRRIERQPTLAHQEHWEHFCVAKEFTPRFSRGGVSCVTPESSMPSRFVNVHRRKVRVNYYNVAMPSSRWRIESSIAACNAQNS